MKGDGDYTIMMYLLSFCATIDQTLSSGCMCANAEVPTTSPGINPVTNDILKQQNKHLKLNVGKSEVIVCERARKTTIDFASHTELRQKTEQDEKYEWGERYCRK